MLRLGRRRAMESAGGECRAAMTAFRRKKLSYGALATEAAHAPVPKEGN